MPACRSEVVRFTHEGLYFILVLLYKYLGRNPPKNALSAYRVAPSNMYGAREVCSSDYSFAAMRGMLFARAVFG
jgi:hypothetical protein